MFNWIANLFRKLFGGGGDTRERGAQPTPTPQPPEPAPRPEPTPATDHSGPGPARPMPVEAAAFDVDPTSGDLDIRPQFIPAIGYAARVTVTGIRNRDLSVASGAPFALTWDAINKPPIVSGKTVIAHERFRWRIVDGNVVIDSDLSSEGEIADRAPVPIAPAFTVRADDGHAEYAVGSTLDDTGSWSGTVYRTEQVDEHLNAYFTLHVAGRDMEGHRFRHSVLFRKSGWFESIERKPGLDHPSDYLHLAVEIDG